MPPKTQGWDALPSSRVHSLSTTQSSICHSAEAPTNFSCYYKMKPIGEICKIIYIPLWKGSQQWKSLSCFILLVLISSSSSSAHYYLLFFVSVFNVEKRAVSFKHWSSLLMHWKGTAWAIWACLSGWSRWRVMWSGVPRAHWTFDLFCWDYWSRLIVSTSCAAGRVVPVCDPSLSTNEALTNSQGNWSFL